MFRTNNGGKQLGEEWEQSGKSTLVSGVEVFELSSRSHCILLALAIDIDWLQFGSSQKC